MGKGNALETKEGVDYVERIIHKYIGYREMITNGQKA